MVVDCKCMVDWQEISDTLVRQEFSLQFRSRFKKGKEKLSLLIPQRKRVSKRQAVSKAGNLLCTTPASMSARTRLKLSCLIFLFFFLISRFLFKWWVRTKRNL